MEHLDAAQVEPSSWRVVTDRSALFLGAQLGESSALVPDDAQLGTASFEDWFQESMKAA